MLAIQHPVLRRITTKHIIDATNQPVPLLRSIMWGGRCLQHTGIHGGRPGVWVSVPQPRSRDMLTTGTN
eukprot:2661204-Rhodomonas_salina.1